MNAPTALGRAARPDWPLREDASFLNHGSYGASPRAVIQTQRALREAMDAHPDAFMARIRPDGDEAAVRGVARALAGYVGTHEDRLALVENATHGVHVALRSATLAAGDEILATDHQYNAVRLAIEARCRETGARPQIVELPVPLDADVVAERVMRAIGPRTRLAVLDHVTSPTALRFPLDRLLPQFARREIPVIVDGAHAVGQIDLALDALGADWYITNAHKWLLAPRGSALLHAAAHAVPRTHPLITSHYAGLGFPRAFDYIGTRDYTAWLAAPAAMQFRRALDDLGLAAHIRRLVEAGSHALACIGAQAVAPPDASLWMRAFVLPQQRPALDADALQVMDTLWTRERIQIRCAIVARKLLLRFCAQAYVAEDELVRLGVALDHHGWPARA